METSDYIAIISIIVTVLISVIGSIRKIITSTKKFELTEHYTKELLDWYERTICTIKKIKVVDNKTEKKLFLAELSALIDVGRFYYPNIIRGDSFGEEKPDAFKGYRHIALDFLVWIFDLLEKNDCSKVTEQVELYEREFTSVIFNRLNPRERNNKYSKYTDITLPEEMASEEYFENWRYDTKSSSIIRVSNKSKPNSLHNSR